MDINRQWIREARQGDADAFARLYESVYRDLYRFALYTLRNQADAEDAVGEAVADAYASISKLRNEDAFRSWIFRILINKCKNRMREYVGKNIELNEETGGITDGEDLVDHIHLRQVFRQLKDGDRLIISLHVFGGYTNQEIARMLHMNPNTVRTRESRALKKMAACLEAEEVSD